MLVDGVPLVLSVIYENRHRLRFLSVEIPCHVDGVSLFLPVEESAYILVGVLSVEGEIRPTIAPREIFLKSRQPEHHQFLYHFPEVLIFQHFREVIGNGSSKAPLARFPLPFQIQIRAPTDAAAEESTPP